VPQQPQAGEDGLDGVVSKIDSRKPEKVKRRNNFRILFWSRNYLREIMTNNGMAAQR